MTATILLVDDSAAIRSILRRALEAGGYGVAEAANGQIGLEVCRAESPDLVLLDIDMPVMEGPAVLAEMQNDAALADIPVLFLTARTSGGDVAEGLKLGAQDYLRKPCEPAELLARVEGVLRRHTREDMLRGMADEADRLGNVDLLTGLPNRRQLEMRIDQMMSTLGKGARVGLILMDIDHFKQVNDTEGHLIGDSVLCIVADRLRAAIDDDHLLVRWGGEEFVVMATGLDDGEIAALAERLRVAVGQTPFDIGEDHTLPITISAGCVSRSFDALDAALRAADDALYTAKRDGRNRIATSTA